MLASEDIKITPTEQKYFEIEDNLLEQIKQNNWEECEKIIKQNSYLIRNYFDNDVNRKKFLNKFNYILINIFCRFDIFKNTISKKNDLVYSGCSDFKIFENILNNELFTKIRNEFRESDVLVKACQKKNFKTIEWLIKKMDINYCVCDEKGRTALMYAAEDWKLVYVIEKLLIKTKDSLYITDREGNTALYYSIHNINNFNRILYISKNISHVNYNNESIILYCAKNKVYISFNLSFKEDLDVDEDVFIKEGKREFLKCVDNFDSETLSYLSTQYNFISKTKNIVKHIMNEIGETLFSKLIKKYYDAYINDINDEIYEKYIKMLKILVTKLKCNINCAIDEEGNTPIMFFLLIKDYNSINYILSCEGIDLSIKNKRGINASYLSLFIEKEEKKLRMNFIKHPTFDYSYLDQHNNNLISHFIIRDYYDEALKFLSKSNDKYILTSVNDKRENTITIIIKSGHSVILKDIFSKKNECFDQQDHLGNTPLHYAIKLKDKDAISLLSYYGANTNINNNEGLTASELAKRINDPEIFECLNNPSKVFKKKSKMKNLFSLLKNDDDKKEKSKKDKKGKSKGDKKDKNEDNKFVNEEGHNDTKSKDEYNYLLIQPKTLYSLSNKTSIINKKHNNDFFDKVKCDVETIPIIWAYHLSTSACFRGYNFYYGEHYYNTVDNAFDVYEPHDVGLSGDYNSLEYIFVTELKYNTPRNYYENNKYKFYICDGQSHYL